jgi:hypothetical protein
MDDLISYVSLFALILVVILLVWSLILTHREKARKMTVRGRLAALRKKIDSLPDNTEEDKSRKKALYDELTLEYLENILGGIEQLKIGPRDKGKIIKKTRKKKK